MEVTNQIIHSQDGRKPLIVFYNVELDDAGLDPYEFRAYNRIARQSAGTDKGCQEKAEDMAKACKMSRSQLFEALKGLRKRHMVRRIPQDGRPSIYRLTDKSEWTDPTDDSPEETTKIHETSSKAPSPTRSHAQSDGMNGRKKETLSDSVHTVDTYRPPDRSTIKTPAVHTVDGGVHKMDTSRPYSGHMINIDNKNKETNKSGGEVSIPEAMARIFPGYRDNWQFMDPLVRLTIEAQATAKQVLAFPEWLKTAHPKKALTQFAFRDHFHQSLGTGKTDATPIRPSHCTYCAGTGQEWEYDEQQQPKRRTECRCRRATRAEQTTAAA